MYLGYGGPESRGEGARLRYGTTEIGRCLVARMYMWVIPRVGWVYWGVIWAMCMYFSFSALMLDMGWLMG